MYQIVLYYLNFDLHCILTFRGWHFDKKKEFSLWKTSQITCLAAASFPNWICFQVPRASNINLRKLDQPTSCLAILGKVCKTCLFTLIQNQELVVLKSLQLYSILHLWDKSSHSRVKWNNLRKFENDLLHKYLNLKVPPTLILNPTLVRSWSQWREESLYVGLESSWSKLLERFHRLWNLIEKYSGQLFYSMDTKK